MGEEGAGGGGTGSGSGSSSMLIRLAKFLEETHFDDSCFTFQQNHCAKFRKGETDLGSEQKLLHGEVFALYLEHVEELLTEFLEEESQTAEAMFEQLKEEGGYERGDMAGAALRNVVACLDYEDFAKQMVDISEDFFGDSTSEEYSETDDEDGDKENKEDGAAGGGEGESNGH